MIMQRIKDNFNPYKPLSIKGYNKSLGWIILWSWLLGIPALILEKNGAEVDILALIVAIIIGGSQYMLFIFTIKRFRSMNIPTIWATAMFIIPLHLLCFIVAESNDNFIVKMRNKLGHLVKEDTNA